MSSATPQDEGGGDHDLPERSPAGAGARAEGACLGGIDARGSLAQGRVAAANMFAATPVRSDYRVVPRVTFTEPPIAGVGLTEEQAHSTGRDVRCSLVEVASLGKALVESEAKGLVKLVADAGSGEILGGHIAAAAAGEMIHEVVAAMAAHATVRDLAEAIHAFPNFAEGVKAAARQWVAARQD